MSENLPSFKISLAGSPNSCIIKIGKQKFRSLVDTGAEVSLMHRRIYDSLRVKPKLQNKKINLNAVSGDVLKVDGCIDLTFVVGGSEMKHQFYVVREMNRNLILGSDWLLQNGVRIYYDLGCLRVGDKTYVNLEEDIHISSVARIKYTTILRPHTATVCYAKVRQNPDLPPKVNYQVSAVERGFVYKQPGLQVIDSVSKLRKDRSIPVLVVNNTNKTMRVFRHGVLAKIESLVDQNVAEVSSVLRGKRSDNKLDLKDLHVAEESRPLIETLISRNSDLFASKDSELGHTETVKMKIDTGNSEPIKLRPYRTPLNNRKVIDETVEEMLDANIIRRSRSPWSFPVVIVDKKDGSKRFCVDFRKLNQVTKKNSYPLPVIDDILALLGKAKYFTSLDLKSGYWQVLMDEDDKEKTAFACHRGLFEFNVMPFGLSNAPAVFQELMSVVLQGLNEFAIAYLDDILIFSSTLEDHLKHLDMIFDRLRKHDLRLKLKKCSFLQLETNYLGFIVDRDGIRPDPKKVEAIRSLPVPTCVREVRSFVGMSSYYRRFIPNFSEIAEPIIALTKKHAHFKWTEKHDKAFQYLKDSLSVVPLLAYPDPNKPYTLYTDASGTCIGACLTQKSDSDEEALPNVSNEKPIYYLSHKLSRTQCKWSTVEKEAYAIHFALQKLDHYLHGAQFVIKTDHKPLKYLLESPMQNRKIQLWALSMAGYNCTIEYIAGTTNTCADLLSRKPDDLDQNKKEEEMRKARKEEEVILDVNDNTFEVNVIDSNQFEPKKFASCETPFEDTTVKPDGCLPGLDMIAEQNNDDELVEFKTSLLHGEPSKAVQQRYLVVDNILYYLTDPDNDPVLRLYVPRHLRALVIKQYHDENGHLGVQKTFDSIRQKYFWPSLFKELYQYVTSCTTCQTRSLQKIRQPLQETDIPPYPMAKLSLDLSGPYPKSLSNNKYIIAFVDWYSGWPEAFAVPDKTADTVAHLLIEEIFPRFGCPLQIVTDNGSENVNKVVRETMNSLNIHHVLTSVYHPQSNAKVERFHRTLHDVLAKKLSENLQTWDLYLNQALAAIRFNISVSSKFSPFFLLYNRDVVLPVDNLMRPRRKYHGEDTHQIALQEQHRIFTLVRRHLKKAKKRQAKYADRGTKEVEFQVNDAVYYKNNQRRGKLDAKWRPFYRIIEKKGPATYVIKNQLDGSTAQVHAELLRAANVDEWDIPVTTEGRPIRKAAFAIPPEDSTSEEDSESEPDGPTEKIAKRYIKEREDSDDEENIPLMELQKRLRARKQTQEKEQFQSEGESSGGGSEVDVAEPMEALEPENDSSLRNESSAEESIEDDAMSVDGVAALSDVQSISSEPERKKKFKKKHGSSKNIKQLLKAISDMF